jgi:hypothetical protein
MLVSKMNLVFTKGDEYYKHTAQYQKYDGKHDFDSN